MLRHCERTAVIIFLHEHLLHICLNTAGGFTQFVSSASHVHHFASFLLKTSKMAICFFLFFLMAASSHAQETVEEYTYRVNPWEIIPFNSTREITSEHIGYCYSRMKDTLPMLRKMPLYVFANRRAKYLIELKMKWQGDPLAREWHFKWPAHIQQRRVDMMRGYTFSFPGYSGMDHMVYKLICCKQAMCPAGERKKRTVIFFQGSILCTFIFYSERRISVDALPHWIGTRSLCLLQGERLWSFHESFDNGVFLGK